jgi:hypothetical protein
MHKKDKGNVSSIVFSFQIIQLFEFMQTKSSKKDPFCERTHSHHFFLKLWKLFKFLYSKILISKMVKIVVGIDLGTTYSCIAAYMNNKFEVLSDYNGNKTIPSFVAFPDDSVEVGHVAKENFLVDPTSRVYGNHFKLVNPS